LRLRAELNNVINSIKSDCSVKISKVEKRLKREIGIIIQQDVSQFDIKTLDLNSCNNNQKYKIKKLFSVSSKKIEEIKKEFNDFMEMDKLIRGSIQSSAPFSSLVLIIFLCLKISPLITLIYFLKISSKKSSSLPPITQNLQLNIVNSLIPSTDYSLYSSLFTPFFSTSFCLPEFLQFLFLCISNIRYSHFLCSISKFINLFYLYL
jgi:hypothetical protein